MRRYLLTVVASAVAALSAGASQAANLIVDGGFENPTVTTPGQFQSGYAAYNPGQTFGGPSNNAWTVIGTGNNVTVTSTTEYTNGPTYYNGNSGLQWLDLTGTNDNGSAVGVSQTVTTTAGTAYLLSFYVGTFTDAASAVDVKLNGADLGTFTNPTGGVSGGQGINYEQFSTSFIGSGSDTLSFIYAGGRAADALDDVSLTVAAVPEPSSWAMMLVGFGAVGLALRRRRTPVLRQA